MRRQTLGTLIFVLSLCAPATFAEDKKGAEPPAMTPEQQAEMELYMKAGSPGAPHATLAASVGKYDLVVRSYHEPGAPPMEESGTATRSMMLDGRVMVEDLSSSMMGMPFTGRGMTGYDNVSGKYWSTWTDSMSTGIMVNEGSCDADNACRFTGSWNDPVKKGPVTCRITTRWTSPTTQLFEMFGPGRDGKEMKMMEMVYTRK